MIFSFPRPQKMDVGRGSDTSASSINGDAVLINSKRVAVRSFPRFRSCLRRCAVLWLITLFAVLSVTRRARFLARGLPQLLRRGCRQHKRNPPQVSLLNRDLPTWKETVDKGSWQTMPGYKSKHDTHPSPRIKLKCKVQVQRRVAAASTLPFLMLSLSLSLSPFLDAKLKPARTTWGGRKREERDVNGANHPVAFSVCVCILYGKFRYKSPRFDGKVCARELFGRELFGSKKWRGRGNLSCSAQVPRRSRKDNIDN